MIVIHDSLPWKGEIIRSLRRPVQASAAPPSSVMNLRRLRAGMGSPHPVQPVSRTLSLAWKDWLVLGATLNRSDSRAAVGTR
jgi:hypothetical protein